MYVVGMLKSLLKKIRPGLPEISIVSAILKEKALEYEKSLFETKFKACIC